MQQLIDQITSQYDISTEDANNIIEMVKNYKSDELKNDVTTNTNVETVQQPEVIAAGATATEAAATEENMFQKATHFVEDHLPGGMKQKAEEMLGGLGEKVTGLFK